MPRQAQLGKKNGYWYTRAGTSSGKYFGKVGVVPYSDAKEEFAAYLKTVSGSKVRPGTKITIAELVDRFLDWAEANRSDRTYGERKCHLDRYVNFRSKAGAIIGDLPGTRADAADLLAFKDHLITTAKLDPFTADKYVTSVKAAFNWAERFDVLPKGFRPFGAVEKYRKPHDPLLEGDLPTPDEIKSLLKHADDDLETIRDGSRFRTRRPDEGRTGKSNPYAGFRDLLMVYYNTGARTSELLACTVADFVRSSGLLVLGRHKRSHTMKDASTRRINLNATARGIVERWCKGKGPTDPIFTRPSGRAWDRYSADNRFQIVRERAKVRDEITIYSFRHLWISEAMMHGVDVATVAKMAGTSIAMIEKVYGHFTSDHFREAQDRLDAGRAAQAKRRRGALSAA
jgi:integrase